MQDVQALVSQLLALEEGPLVVTLYLDTHWRDEQQRERVRLFFREHARDARARYDRDDPRRAGLDATLRHLEETLDDIVNRDIHESANGIVLVASEPRGVFEEIVLSEAVPPAMYVDGRPRLAPLLEQLAHLHSALVVEVERTGARILEIRLGEVVDEQGVERDVPQKHKMGGWSQRNLQQWVDVRVQGVWKECAALLERLGLEKHDAWIVLSGTLENAQGFRRLLPQAIAERVVSILPPVDDRRRLLAAARGAIEEERTAREFEELRHVLTQGLSDRNGTVGLQETIMAMNERRVRTLAVSHAFDGTGYRCTNCDGVWMSGATGCVFCGGQTEMVGLREELVRRAARDGAGLLLVPEGNRLDAYHGIGALLRHLSGEERANVPYGAETTPTLAP